MSEDEYTSLRIRRSTHGELTELTRKDQTYDEAVRSLIRLAKHQGGESLPGAEGFNIPVDGELYDFVHHLAEALTRRSPGIVDVGGALGRYVSRTGVFFGYRGESFRDWGVQKARDAKIVTFLDIDDPLTRLSVVVTEGMKALIDHGVKRLQPVLDQTVQILVEEAGRATGGEESGGGED